METIQLNSQGIDVIFLQASLGIGCDGVFGPNTERVLKEFQRTHNLLPDGVCGSKTWDVISRHEKLTEEDFAEVAKMLNVDVPALKAIKEVESGKLGAFYNSGRPVILFEGHIFWKQLQARKIDPTQYVKGNEDVLYKSWTKEFYKKSEEGEYERLKKAWKIHPTAAVESASVGMFQIMGSNYKLCGEEGAKKMWAHAWLSEKEQLKQLCNFIKNSGILVYLKNHDWANVALRYNGKSYAANEYDKKLEKAYNKYK